MKLRNIFVFVLFSVLFVIADSQEVVETNTVIVKEPVIIYPININCVFSSGDLQFTVEDIKTGERLVCVIGLKGDNLSKHLPEIIGHLIKGEQVFIEGHKYQNGKFVLIKNLFAKKKEFKFNEF